MKTLKLACLLIWLSANVIFAQTSDSDYSRYLNGKDLLLMEKYGLAMQALKPLTNSYTKGRYTEYATFLYAVAAFHNKEIGDAKNMFLQIKYNYSDWHKMDEVNLWLFKIYMHEGNYSQALKAQKDIKNPNLIKQTELLSDSYFKSMTTEQLNDLLKENPSEKKLAVALANKIISLPFDKQDRELLENIVSVYELDPQKYRIEEQYKSEKKSRYQIAVLLPFMHKDLQNRSNNLSNDFVIELYEGMVLAQQQLLKSGINIQLHPYDTEKDTSTTSKILDLPEMKHMDLIIGPLFPGPVRQVSEFSFNYKINMLNPLSSNTEIINGNPFAFLFMPTNETLGKKAAEFVSGVTKNKNLMIFYSENTKDSTIAYSYKLEMEKEGFKTRDIIPLQRFQGKTILDMLTKTISDTYNGNDQEPIYVIPRDSVGHIFISTDEAPLAANTITAIEMRGDSIGLVGKEQLLNKNVISIESLEKRGALLIAPSYPNRNSAKTRDMKTGFTEKYNKWPSQNAYIGYESVMTMGKLLDKSGNLFQFEDEIQNFIPGEVLNGVLFLDEKNNQYVPVLKIVDKELVNQNPRPKRKYNE